MQSREITLTRVLRAPRELVFEAWTQPEHLAEWWGPEHWTNPVCLADARPGGSWTIVMRSPDGHTEFHGGGTYLDVEPPARLVFTNIAKDSAGTVLLEGLTTVTLEPLDNGAATRLTLHTRATGRADFAAQMLEGMEPGWNQALDRLERRLPA